MKKFGIVIATVIVMALTGCSSKEKTTTADKVAVEVSTEATTEVTTEETTEEIIEIGEEKNEKSEKTTESVAQITSVTPVQSTSSQQSNQTTSTPKPAQQTSNQTSTPVPTTTEAPKPAQQTSTPKPTTTEAPTPVHQHTWATRTETVEKAWTETVEHPAVTHTELHMQCSYCGGFYSDMHAHQEQYETTNVEHAIAGYHTANQTIVDQEAWTETINHPAVTKTVEYCTGCGATK